MPDTPRDVDAGEPKGGGARLNGRWGSGLAPWQKVVGIIGLLAILLIVIALVVSGGHTPPVQHGS